MSIWNVEGKLVAEVEHYQLNFIQPAKTSRDTLKYKDTYFIKIWKKDNPDFKSIGECSPLWGLSIDPRKDYFELLQMIALDINNYKRWLRDRLIEYPSIRCGLEMALLNLQRANPGIYFNNEVAKKNKRIAINGLVWMGDFDEMKKRAFEKIEADFSTIKIKIGGIDFQQELKLLESIRNHPKGGKVILRLDANGAFNKEEALKKLGALAEFNIHSIEQPIRQGHWSELAQISAASPIPIALDEELIGIERTSDRIKLLQTISPSYLVIKPSLVGGFESTSEWIKLAEERNIGWWVTSALESNVGLNAITQYVGEYNNTLPQGLGTGNLYTNNVYV